MESSSKLLLIHRRMGEIAVNELVDLVITPQFYTLCKEKLPLKYTYQAKKIAPSLFEGLLEEPDNYTYFVYKDADTWVFIAYDPVEITSFLDSKKIPLEKVRKLFFAQQFASDIKEPIILGEQDALTVIDGTVTIVPRMILQEEGTSALTALKVPKKGIRLESGNGSFLSRKQLWTAAAVLVLFGTTWLIEGLRYGANSRALQQEISRLYEMYPGLQNSYTRESIAEKYRKIDKVERKKRYIIGKVAGLLFKGVTLTEFEMDQKKFKAIFVTSGTSVAKRLESLVHRAGFQKSALSKGNMIVIEGML